MSCTEGGRPVYLQSPSTSSQLPVNFRSPAPTVRSRPLLLRVFFFLTAEIFPSALYLSSGDCLALNASVPDFPLHDRPAVDLDGGIALPEAQLGKRVQVGLVDPADVAELDVDALAAVAEVPRGLRCRESASAALLQ